MKFRGATKLQIPSSYSEWTCLSWYGDFYNDYPEGGPFPNAQISGSLGPGSDLPPPPPRVNIRDSSVVEGNRGSAQLKFTVNRSGSREGKFSVDYRTIDGTARAKSDYNAARGTLVFQPGVLSQTITITVNSDHAREPNETLTVQLSNAVGASVVDAIATGTILNDD